MAEHDIWPTEYISAHTANTVAYEYMVGMIQRYAPRTIWGWMR